MTDTSGPSQKEVAAAAKLSIKVVQTILSHDRGVKINGVAEHTQRRVWAEADRLGGYRQRRKRSGLDEPAIRYLGMITPRSAHPFNAEFLDITREDLAGTDFELILRPTGGSPSVEQSAIDELISRNRVAGLILISPTASEVQLEAITQRGIPLVLINASLRSERRNVASFLTDHAGGVRQVFAHLEHLGHTRLAFISGPLRSPTSRARLAAYQREIQARNWTPRVWTPPGQGDQSYFELGFSGCREIFNSVGPRPTAVLAADDIIAIGALRALDSKQIAVPAQVSVVGFDNIPHSAYTIPTLTTVRVESAHRAHEAIRALLTMISMGQGTPQKAPAVLPATVITRSSSGPAPIDQ